MLEHDSPRKDKTVYLADYRPPAFLIDDVELEFDLGEHSTVVCASLRLRRNGEHTDELVLDGEALELLSLRLDGAEVPQHGYRLDEASLTLAEVPDEFVLEVSTRLHPDHNSELSGLYRSGGTFCTQCEAEGFRRITYFLDRPDVLARYTTRITAPRSTCPVLLSNGNLIDEIDLDDGRHCKVWHDPFPKPSYLFALVAGDLARVEDKFVTCSGRNIQLFIYTQRHNIDKCEHAMASLKKAMRWDEEVYGREYDLDRYMIVAVDDFNMGAMENKGLNIFNSKYVLAHPETATDSDYTNIEGVIGHEYFHNWSGNRVTCRDWFQLSLKEGFTVFRDQEFNADMGSRGVKRVQDVNILRTHQFQEDAGPMAHPVRPQSYQQINNFYTMTVYNKGAEVVRMLYRLVGPAGFRRATDLYFDRYDGQAVTTDDFVSAVEAADNIDLTQFRLWYDQAGTPVLRIEEAHDPARSSYTLRVAQSCPATPGQPDKHPFHIPLTIALLDESGSPLPLYCRGIADGPTEAVLQVREASSEYVFEHIPVRPVASVLRGFSAPVRLEFDRVEDDLYFLMTKDDDPFSRWEAGQQLAVKLLLAMTAAVQGNAAVELDHRFVEAFRSNLLCGSDDLAFQREMLCLPSESYLAEFLPVIDPMALHVARQTLRHALAQELEQDFLTIYRGCHDTAAYKAEPQQIGRRALKNLALSYLLELNHTEHRRLAIQQIASSRNMTDVIAALSGLANTVCEERDAAMQSFYARWQGDPLVVDKWLAIQAMSPLEDTLDRVRMLTRYPSFNTRNPNKVRALVGSFAHANPVRFHDPGGAGYEFVADQVIAIDPLNPLLAARLAAAFNQWRRYDGSRQARMRAQLQRIADTERLSRDVREIVTKALSSDP